MMPLKNNLYGLILCGGRSTRMGCDKSLVVYYDMPQRYHLYKMMEGLCEKTFLSCSGLQVDSIDENYQILADLEPYESVGPMAALLTAFENFPTRDFLVLGCDYPFVSAMDLHDFSCQWDSQHVAAAFYNEEEALYEPMLAWYSHHAASGLIKMYSEKQYALQHFLQSVHATKYRPANTYVMTSVDTPVSMIAAKERLTQMELLTR